MCEEFPGTLPSEILDERDRLPEGLLEEIMESRAYARAYAANKRHPTGWSESRIRTLAMEVEHALAEDEING